jgi:hypothetical protein
MTFRHCQKVTGSVKRGSITKDENARGVTEFHATIGGTAPNLTINHHTISVVR